MVRRFYAHGVLYEAGDTIGLTDKKLSDDVMRAIADNSPSKVPVLSDLGKAISGNPDYVVGNATLSYQPESPSGRKACLDVKAVFNSAHRREYEILLNSPETRHKLRFGFLLSEVRKDSKGEIIDGVITAVSLNDTGLGGEIDKFGWEEADV